MSNELKLGSLIEPGREVNRDAVHVAVAPVEAGETLLRGERVFLKNGMAYGGTPSLGEYVGIVDPFLAVEFATVGTRFWLYLFPGSITSLRHEWTHPALESESAPSPRDWLERFAASVGISYDELVVAGTKASCGEWYIQRGSESLRDKISDPETRDSFWRNFTAVTGLKENRSGGFSCSC